MTTTSSSGRSCSRAAATPVAEPGLGVGADDEGHELAAGGQQPVEHLAGRHGDVGAEEGDVAVDDAEHVARVADAGPGQRLLGRDRHRAVPGGHGRTGHRDDVGVHRAAGVEHRERGERLHGRAGGHDVHVDAGAGGGLGRDLGGHEGVAVARQQHDGGRARSTPPPASSWPAEARRPGPEATTTAPASRSSAPMPGPAAHATTASGAGCSRVLTWVAKWVIRMRSGRPAATPASTAAPGSSTCTCTFHRSGPPTTSSESPSPSSVRGQGLDRLRGWCR